MSLQKYTNSEHVDILSPEAHKATEKALHGMDKASARDLTVEERKLLDESLADSQDN